MAVKKKTRKKVRSSLPVQVGDNDGGDSNDAPEPDDATAKRAPQLRPYQWKPGQSGNPSGKAKGRRNFKGAARAILQEIVNEKGLGDKKGRAAYKVLLERAREKAATVKDYRFILEFLRYADEPRAEELIRNEAQKELVDALFPILETFVDKKRWDEFTEAVERMIQRLEEENE